MRNHASFGACPRGVYLKDVENGESKVGRKVPEKETPAFEKRMKKLQQKQQKKQQKRKE